MKKNYFILLIATFILTFNLNAQNNMKEVKSYDLKKIKRYESNESLDFKTNGNKTAACVDTIAYADQKRTGYSALNINNATSAQAGFQYFNAPQAITVRGFDFISYKIDATGGVSTPVTAELYLAGPDSLPTGAPLASTTINVDTTFNNLFREVTFPSPVTVNAPYVLLIGNYSANGIILYCNDWTANDGAQEWLGGADIFGTLLNGYNINVGGAPFDADWLFSPHVSYSLTSDFNKDATCLNTNQTVNFTDNSSPILNDRMYNYAAYLGIDYFSYAYDFGDGNGGYVLDTFHSYNTAGSYTVTLNDTLYGWSNSCFDSYSEDVSVGLSVSVSGSSNPLCNGGSNGTITLNGAGGDAPYTFSSDGTNYSSTNPLTGFTNGTKTLYIQDNLGCTSTVNRTLGQPSAVNINSQTSTPASCGGNDGTITFSAIGGTGTKTYSVDGTNYQASGNFTGLAATTYTLYAKDNNGCVQTSSISVGNAGAPSINSAPANAVTCNGGNNGSLTINGSGGTGSLTYSIDGVNFFSTNTFNNLTSNTYTVIVRDASLCTASQNVFVSQPAPITANAGNDQSVCQDNPNISLSGVIDVATGYSWSAIGGGTFSSPSGQNTTFAPTATQITNGLATVVLTTDGNGVCAAATDTMVLTINAAPIVDAGSDLTVCENNSLSTLAGTVTNAAGGVWSSTLGGIFSSTTALNAVYTNSTIGSDTLVLESTGNGLCAAVYDTMIVTITQAPLVDAGSNFLVCEGDTVNVPGIMSSAGGVTWSTNGTGSFTDTNTTTPTYVFSNADAVSGTVNFTITTTGNGNCIAVSDNATWFVNSAPEFTLGSDTTLCTGGSVNLNVGLGTTDYTYDWNTSETTESIDVTTSGNYSVTVTDTNACEATDAVNITFETCGSIDNSLSSSVSLYPNPSNGIVFVTTEMNEKVSMEVVNILGEIVIEDQLNSKVNNLTVDLSTYNNGVYFFRFTKGNEVITRKINIVK